MNKDPTNMTRKYKLLIKYNLFIAEEKKAAKALVIQSKVKSVARMNKMFTILREESETLLKLKNMSPDGKLPRGLLLEGKPAIKNALK
jgi:serine/threonine-protein phosphatase 2B catalytic subunit